MEALAYLAQLELGFAELGNYLDNTEEVNEEEQRALNRAQTLIQEQIALYGGEIEQQFENYVNYDGQPENFP